MQKLPKELSPDNQEKGNRQKKVYIKFPIYQNKTNRSMNRNRPVCEKYIKYDTKE